VLVLGQRFLILSLACLFSWAVLVNAVGHCFLDSNHPTKSYGQIPLSISCLDNLDHPFLAQVNQRDKRIYFSKAEKRPADIHLKGLLPEETVNFTRIRPALALLISSSVPIYQFKNVYRI
jgi:hypothetical protein